MNKKYLKGFMLLDTMISIGVFFILISMIAFNLSGFKKINNDLDNKNFSVKLLNNIVYFRQRALLEKREYCINFNNKNQIKFLYNSKTKCVLNFPKGFKLYSINNSSKNKIIRINKRGFPKNPCSIVYKDRMNRPHIITICVGSDYVSIKK